MKGVIFLYEWENGLTEEEAAARLQNNGRNELEQERKKTVPEAFLEQLNDPLICVLLVAAFVSFLLKEYSDALIIAVVVVVNAAVGVIQEGKAQKALDALKQLTSPHAVVRRSGKIMEIPAAELVVGDVVILETGAQVPADLRLTKAWNLKVEESVLTGESVPVDKTEGAVFMSTMVTGGRGEGVVTAIGMDTEIGKIASMIQKTPKELTPLQKKLADLGKLLSAVSVLLCVLLFVIAVVQKRNVFEMLLTAISLAVAAVPEGLPAIVTIVLAMSVSRMVKFHAIVRKLPSVETLGCVNVVCSDKTGTLTQNKMTVTACYVDERRISVSVRNIREQADIPVEFLEGLVLCNDAVIPEKRAAGTAAGTESKGKGTKTEMQENKKEFGDPTELALLHMAANCGIRKATAEQRYPRIEERSFDSARKMMTTVHQREHAKVSYTKGAPDVVLKRCTKILLHGKIQPLTEIKRRKIQETTEDMSVQALRVLALAMKQQGDLLNEKELIFIGLVGMKDPIRPEAKEAVTKFRQAGVRTVMITGDHVDTALAIARELGIAQKSSECMTGALLDQLSDKKLMERLPSVNVFARVSPEHKVRIVQLLKSSGNVVAMTGDGVNDAPSLKMADIGVAMGMNGTDVAKNASDMILTDDNFATIEQAIEEGRSIYKNIKKTVIFLLSSNFGEIITMFVTMLLGLASPLKASHILWINLITDSLPALALGVDQNDREALMQEPPRPSAEGLFAGGGLACTIFYGVLIAAISLTAFLKLPWEMLKERQLAITLANISVILQDKEVLTRAQTYAFTVLGMSQLFHAWGMRDVRTSVFSGIFSGIMPKRGSCEESGKTGLVSGGSAKHREVNRVMGAAFAVGLILQLAVTEIPYLVQVFGTASLSAGEWVSLLVLAAFPILAHEIFAVLFRLKWE